MSKIFLTVGSAAKKAGFSATQFGRIIKKYNLPLLKFSVIDSDRAPIVEKSPDARGFRHFILAKTVDKWLKDMKNPDYVAKFRSISPPRKKNKSFDRSQVNQVVYEQHR